MKLAMSVIAVIALATVTADAKVKKSDGTYVTSSGVKYTVKKGRPSGLGCGKKYPNDKEARRACQQRVMAGGQP